MESRQVPPHHLHHALPGLRLLSNAGGNHTNKSLALESLKEKCGSNIFCMCVCVCVCMHYLTNKSGCAKKSAYISNKDRLSRMKVGRTTCAQEAGRTVKLEPR